MPPQARRIPWTADNEREFRTWYRTRATKLGLAQDPDDPKHYYDYRRAFVNNAEPNAKGHWPSTYKREGHPNLIVKGRDTRTGKKVK